MKFSSALKAVAGAVAASLIMVTANPVQADPVSTPYTESIEAIAEQSGPYVDAHHLLPTDAARTKQAARADATIAGVTDSGNTLVLGKGHFVKRGDTLAIVGESGNTVVTAPLQAIFGDQVMDLNVILKEGGRSATFLPAADSFRPAPITVMHAREGWIGYDTRLREFYDAWGKYLNRAEVENFPGVIAGGVFGGLAGTAAGWAIGFLAGALVANGMLLFTLGLACGHPRLPSSVLRSGFLRCGRRYSHRFPPRHHGGGALLPQCHHPRAGLESHRCRPRAHLPLVAAAFGRAQSLRCRGLGCRFHRLLLRR